MLVYSTLVYLNLLLQHWLLPEEEGGQRHVVQVLGDSVHPGHHRLHLVQVLT